MLHGGLFLKILAFSLPLAASSMLQQLFNSVDVAVVGRFVGSNALAAVGSNGPVISLLINLFLGVSMGANAVLSHHIGQNDQEGIRRTVSTVAVVAVVSGLFLAAAGCLAARPILELIGTPEEILEMAVLYLRIYFLGIPFFMVFNFGAAVLRSLGDTRRPLYILVAAGIVNTALNLFFVLVLDMGVEGVAIATSIANAVSAALIVRILLREAEPFRLHTRGLHVDRRQLARILKIGVPAGLQGVIFSLSNVIIQSTINSYGADAIAGSAAALNFEVYAYFIIQAFNGAAISFIAQNYGAGRMYRVWRIFKICMVLGVCGCALLNALFIWQDEFFLNFFSTSPAVHEYARIRMNYVLALQAMACSYEVTGSCMRGMGRSLTPTVLVVFGTCLLRIVWVFVVSPSWRGFDHLLVVYPLSWLLTGTMVVVAFVRFARREERRLSRQGAERQP